jgi:cystathionine beta-lyase/cystathionine gamma-synthase
MRLESIPLVFPNYETVSHHLPAYEDWETALLEGVPAWMYLTDGNPTVRELELAIARMQGREDAWVTSAGKSAIAATLIALLSAGDHFILLREGYKSTRHFAEKVLSRMGISHTVIGVEDTKNIEPFIQKGKTKLVLIESPTNPMTRVVDIAEVSRIARSAGLKILLDNSLAGFHQHRGLDVDIYLHSLSKFTTGSGDVMGGGIIASSELIRSIKSAHVWNAETMATQVALTHLKGLQTYSLRYQRQASSAFELAKRLEAHPKVSRILYPGLRSHPDHEIAVRQMTDFGTIIAFDIANESGLISEFINTLKNFRIAFGAGFTQSLVNPAWLFYARSFPEEQKGASGIYKSTIRLSIGTEPVEELWSDLEEALGVCP